MKLTKTTFKPNYYPYKKKSHFFFSFYSFRFFKSIEHLQTTFSMFKKSALSPLLLLYISVMQHLAPLTINKY